MPWHPFNFFAAARRFLQQLVASAEALPEFVDRTPTAAPFDPRYQGLYDNRLIDPGSMEDLQRQGRAERWRAGTLGRIHTRLWYPELGTWMTAHNRRLEECHLLRSLANADPRAFDFRGRRRAPTEAPDLLRQVEAELLEDRKWFAAHDRRVFLVHYQMVQQLNPLLVREFEDRYRFHLGLQDMYRELTIHQFRLQPMLASISGLGQLEREDFQEVLGIFRQAYVALASSLAKAQNLTVPDRVLTQGRALRAYLLNKKLIYQLYPDERSLRREWIYGFLAQFNEVCAQTRRLHFQSLRDILTLQDRIAHQWRTLLETTPEAVAAELDLAEVEVIAEIAPPRAAL